MTTLQSTTSRVDEFATAVRAALADLPDDEVDDLTDGLEADLVEQADDAEAPQVDLGDPVAYADELRAAAGLPLRNAAPTVETKTSARDRLAKLGPNLVEDLRGSAVGSAVLDFLIALRPAWWVLRGWAFFVLLGLLFGFYGVVPDSPLAWVAFFALVVVSVQWGRGTWLPKRWATGAKTTIGVAAGLSLLFAVPISATAMRASEYSGTDDASVDYVTPGLSADGTPLANIFAYDSDGALLTDVQLFDQDGHPLDLVGDSSPQNWYTTYRTDGYDTTVVPNEFVPGRLGWNIYPLREIDETDVNYSTDPAGDVDPGDTRRADAPFDRVQPLARDGADTASPSPALAPDASATPTPSESPTAP